MTALEVQGIVKCFGGIHALAGADLRVSVGESVGLIGPNGSGKTTLLKVMSGFESPTAGTITWDGRPAAGWSIRRRVDAGIVRTFQQMAVFPDLSVRDNLRIAAECSPRHRGAPPTPTELAEFVGIAHLEPSPAGRLSWGESRLLGIALALALRPSVLLVDEPFAGLSPLAADQIVALLRRIHSGGTGICLVDHDMDYLRSVCRRTVMLVDGVVVADGPTDEVLASDAVRDAYLGAPAC